MSCYYKWRKGVRPSGSAPADAQSRLGRLGDQPRRHRRVHGIADHQRDVLRRGRLHQAGGDRADRRVRPSEADARSFDPPHQLGRPGPRAQLSALGDRHAPAGPRAPRLHRSPHDAGGVPSVLDTSLHGTRYQRDPARAWDERIEMSGPVGARLDECEAAVADAATRIAVTEGHLSLALHNTNPILMEWLTRVYTPAP